MPFFMMAPYDAADPVSGSAAPMTIWAGAEDELAPEDPEDPQAATSKADETAAAARPTRVRRGGQTMYGTSTPMAMVHGMGAGARISPTVHRPGPCPRPFTFPCY